MSETDLYFVAEVSNLVLMRNSTLGQSAPSLSNSMVSCTSSLNKLCTFYEDPHTYHKAPLKFNILAGLIMKILYTPEQ